MSKNEILLDITSAIFCCFRCLYSRFVSWLYFSSSVFTPHNGISDSGLIVNIMDKRPVFASVAGGEGSEDQSIESSWEGDSREEFYPGELFLGSGLNCAPPPSQKRSKS